MGKKKGNFQKKQRLTDLSIDPEPESPQADEDEFLDEMVVPITLDSENRVVQRVTTGERKQVVDFCIEQQTRCRGDWEPVIRIDCKHGMVHADIYKEGQGQVGKEPIAELDDLDRGWEIACGRILDKYQWEGNLRRWRDG